ncbi:type II secretion system protein J [alpha proteobacterium Q-1]|nr:type II secretion system protein J [alpha proteobacterium Q-1]
MIKASPIKMTGDDQGRRATGGFTLVEVLLAVAIFAVIAAAGAGVLAVAVDGRGQMADLADDLDRLNKARALMKSDFAQIARRPVRDAMGNRQPFVFYGNDQSGADQPLLILTRHGWDNPDALLPRGGLQWVDYRLQDGVLIRRACLYPDRVPETPCFDQPLLLGIESLSLRFRVGDQWLDRYELRSGGNAAIAGGNLVMLPRALEIITKSQSLGSLRQLFLLPGGP